MKALRIKDLTKPNGPFGRSKLFADMAAGRLVARKIGGATVIHEDDWRRYLEGEPRLHQQGGFSTAPGASCRESTF